MIDNLDDSILHNYNSTLKI
jgi:hypothetical protein